jgi:hypothetical protein
MKAPPKPKDARNWQQAITGKVIRFLEPNDRKSARKVGESCAKLYPICNREPKIVHM